jgi:hypothetical protein
VFKIDAQKPEPGDWKLMAWRASIVVTELQLASEKRSCKFLILKKGFAGYTPPPVFCKKRQEVVENKGSAMKKESKEAATTCSGVSYGWSVEKLFELTRGRAPQIWTYVNSKL